MTEVLAAAEPDQWSGEGRGTMPLPSLQARSTPHLSVAGFEGPLDFLVEMVRRQRVDLGRLSILTLTDQLVAAIEAGEGGIPLERRADWLVMASGLLLLKAQLLAPASPEEAEDALAAAERRLELLDELARMRAGADWLAARSQLGRDTFGRGQETPPPARPQAELIVAFLEATLVMLEGREGNEGKAAEPAPVYCPAPLDLWRVADARQRIATLLHQHPEGLALEGCLPPFPSGAAARHLRVRASLASTLVAGLEMARDGTIILAQAQVFGPVTLALALEA